MVVLAFVRGIVIVEKIIRMRTKEQLWEVSQARAEEFAKKYPSIEILNNLNLRELALRLDLPRYENLKNDN